MYIKKLVNKDIWIDGITFAIYSFAVIETIAAISGLALEDFCPSISWNYKLLIIIVTFLLVWLIICIILLWWNMRTIKIKIRNIDVIITTGDLFKLDGWRVIPFNEFYNTETDDTIVAKKSLNGIFIEQYVADKSKLEQKISDDKSVNIKNEESYPLGHIIPYVEDDNNRYMLLALSHFDKSQKQAMIKHEEYEACLINMWNEICRTYANYPIVLPLIGSGMTRIHNYSEKNEEQLLRCILCTLKHTNVQIGKPITIVLTEETVKKINLYNIKKQF